MRVKASTFTTGEEFDSLPYEEGRLWELLDGELIPLPSPTPEHQSILQEILFALMHYLRSNPGRGLVFTGVEFALSENYRVRPDVLVLLQESAWSLDLTKVPVPGAPDIAVEIISPSERSSNTQEKLQGYLRHGTREVWQVYPKSESVVLHRRHGSTTLTGDQHLTGDQQMTSAMLPGFSLEVESLFRGALG